MFSVYVLYSQKHHRIYIGQTQNLEKRLEAHHSGLVFSTKPYCPWILIYSEFFSTRSLAMKREKQLKTSRGRNWIYDSLLNAGVRRLTD